jgi:hypothetical protein
MSRRSWLPLAVVLLVMACSATAWAEGDIISAPTRFQSLRWQNARNGAITDSSGNALETEAFKDRDLWLNSSLTDIDTVSVGNGCDSTATAIYTAPYGRLFLHIKCRQGSAAVATAGVITWARLAIEVDPSYDIIADSTSAVPLLSQSSPIDSLFTSIGGTTAGTAALRHPWEFLVTLTNPAALATKWGSPFGGYFELANARSGMPYWAPYTKIRVRLVETNLATTLSNPAIVKLNMRLVGRPF